MGWEQIETMCKHQGYQVCIRSRGQGTWVWEVFDSRNWREGGGTADTLEAAKAAAERFMGIATMEIEMNPINDPVEMEKQDELQQQVQSYNYRIDIVNTKRDQASANGLDSLATRYAARLNALTLAKGALIRALAPAGWVEPAPPQPVPVEYDPTPTE